MNHYFNPVKICQGKGCLAKLPDLLQSLVADKGSDVLLIVWSECVLEHEIIKDLLNKNEYSELLNLLEQNKNVSNFENTIKIISIKLELSLLIKEALNIVYKQN